MNSECYTLLKTPPNMYVPLGNAPVIRKGRQIEGQDEIMSNLYLTLIFIMTLLQIKALLDRNFLFIIVLILFDFYSLKKKNISRTNIKKKNKVVTILYNRFSGENLNRT